jgi:hypothetical protein
MTEAMSGNHEAAPNGLERLLGPASGEVSCEACFEQLDRYVELELAGADPDAELPGLRAHLEGCSACRQDHESLLALVSEEDSGA